ncbi:MAG: protoporphyrinogen oxidase [Planctomycetia bacterium]|nr:protoporphyrinogen oxidase [Planctomycetia bacterium]
MTPTTETPQNARKRVVIIGAGISGLAAAWRLKDYPENCDFTIWERADRVGGVIGTRIHDDCLCELSVDNFITTVPYGVALCRELGLDSALVSTNSSFRRTLVVHKGRLCPLPDGFMTMAPTKLYPMLVTPLLSPLGKLRCGMELVLPRRKSNEDESLAHFAIRRLGKEAFERIIEPLVGGIYGGDPYKLSIQAALPRFAEMEKKSRSLIWAMTKTQRQARQTKREEESGARYSFFVTVEGGMQRLPEKLADAIGREKIELNRSAVRLEKVERNAQIQWRVFDQQGASELFDAVLFAANAHAVADAIHSAAPELAQLYRQTEYTSVAIVHVAYRNEQITRPVKAMGFVVPSSEGSGVIAGSFSSYKYPTRAPKDTTLLRLFLGGSRAPEVMSLSDEQLVERVQRQMETLLGVSGAPVALDVARFPHSMPQYYLGRLQWRERLDAALANSHGIALAGAALDGVGLPACVKSGYDAAHKTLNDLGLALPMNR